MSGIRAAHSVQPDSSMRAMPSAPPSLPQEAQQVQRMQDLLYDILATGVDSERTDAPIEIVERFLHEHARSPKSAAEFRAFFAQHGLTNRVALAAPAEVAGLPPLVRVAPPPLRRASVAPPMPALPPALPPSLAQDGAELDEHPVAFDLARAPSRGPRRRPVLTFATAACMLVIAGALYAGSLHLLEMRGELARSEERASESRALIESLRAQTIGLESSLAANGELIQRMEQKSDLMLQSMERAAEEAKKPQRRWRAAQ